MPTAVIEIPARVDPPRKRWTREEFDALSSSGLLNNQKLELIEGELINKMGKRPPHMLSASRLLKWAMIVFGFDLVFSEPSIDVAPEDNPTSEPEPDLIVLNREVTQFANERVRPQDIALIVEVADSSLAFDLTTKAALYARAAIIEYWVLDIPGRRMIVHRDPQAGRYLSVAAYSAEESVAPLAAPGSPFRIRDAFPG
jgi:Uma2 family endonuclease